MIATIAEILLVLALWVLVCGTAGALLGRLLGYFPPRPIRGKRPPTP